MADGNLSKPGEVVAGNVECVEGKNYDRGPGNKILMFGLMVFIIVAIVGAIFILSGESSELVLNSELSEGKSFSLKENQGVEIEVGGERYEVKVGPVIREDSVGLIIKGKEVEFEVNKETEIDFDADGVFDVVVKMVSFSEEGVVLFVGAVEEEVFDVEDEVLRIGVCVEDWSCGDWSLCNGIFEQVRECVDLEGCGDGTTRLEERSCGKEDIEESDDGANDGSEVVAGIEYTNFDGVNFSNLEEVEGRIEKFNSNLIFKSFHSEFRAGIHSVTITIENRGIEAENNLRVLYVEPETEFVIEKYVNIDEDSVEEIEVFTDMDKAFAYLYRVIIENENGALFYHRYSPTSLRAPDCYDKDEASPYLKGSSKSNNNFIQEYKEVAVNFDACASESLLYEKVCNESGFLVIEEIECENGCDDGACLR